MTPIYNSNKRRNISKWWCNKIKCSSRTSPDGNKIILRLIKIIMKCRRLWWRRRKIRRCYKCMDRHKTNSSYIIINRCRNIRWLHKSGAKRQRYYQAKNGPKAPAEALNQEIELIRAPENFKIILIKVNNQISTHRQFMQELVHTNQ